jgi:monothiol glutaredoxin
MSQTTQPEIIAWLKPTCGWSNGVRAILKKYELRYEDRDIINNPDHYDEMVQRSGQPLSPCLAVGGQMLADVSGAEVEAWLIEHGYVQASDAEPESPTDRACDRHHRPAAV